jgi:hypothetical protein
MRTAECSSFIEVVLVSVLMFGRESRRVGSLAAVFLLGAFCGVAMCAELILLGFLNHQSSEHKSPFLGRIPTRSNERRCGAEKPQVRLTSCNACWLLRANGANESELPRLLQR